MTERVLVYRLHEPGELDDRAAVLEQLLAVPGPARPIDPSFTAMPAGCFRWVDRGRRYSNDAVDLLPATADEAARAAVAYMRAVNAAASRHRQARGLDATRFPDPFPVNALRAGAVRRVPSHERERRDRDDHWLTSWKVWLPASATAKRPPAPVLGGVVEVRIGSGGQVIGVVSRVRPWRAVLSRPAFAWAETHEHGSKHPGAHVTDHAPGPAPAMVYVSDNPEEPQRFLSPSWIVLPANSEAHSHAARHAWPACDHTLFPEIMVQRRGDEATLRARILAARPEAKVVEHGREWRLRWSVAALHDFLAGESRVTEASTAHLPEAGLYQVALEVEHVPTGALRSTHAQIPVSTPPGR